MNRTFSAKKADIKREQFIVDAKGKILGRLAAKIATILRGKHKPIFTPHIDTGDSVVVFNAEKIRVTGRKMHQKIYRRFSGYPGGLREVNLETMLKKNPSNVIRLAVKRMLPPGPLGRDMIKKLKIYNTEQHPHKGGNFINLEV